MKKWAWVVALLYGFSLVLLTLPVLLSAFWDFEKNLAPWTEPELISLLASWPYWLGIVFFMLSQAALLVIPVAVSSNRPASRRTVWLPIITSALMMSLLAAGLFLAIAETARGKMFTDENIWFLIALGVLILSWLVWGAVFYKWGKRSDPGGLINKLCRILFAGSILELLVAVPTHIVARYRNYCCAGFGTFVGITFGLAVMLMSFGPGVFFLFVKRWKQLHPGK